MISIRQIPTPSPGEVPQTKYKNFTLGAWPPNLTLDPMTPRNLSRALRGAHDHEKISEIALTVAEKIEFEKKLAPPSSQTGSRRGHVTECIE